MTPQGMIYWKNFWSAQFETRRSCLPIISFTQKWLCPYTCPYICPPSFGEGYGHLGSEWLCFWQWKLTYELLTSPGRGWGGILQTIRKVDQRAQHHYNSHLKCSWNCFVWDITFLCWTKETNGRWEEIWAVFIWKVSGR